MSFYDIFEFTKTGDFSLVNYLVMWTLNAEEKTDE